MGRWEGLKLMYFFKRLLTSKNLFLKDFLENLFFHRHFEGLLKRSQWAFFYFGSIWRNASLGFDDVWAVYKHKDFFNIIGMNTNVFLKDF